MGHFEKGRYIERDNYHQGWSEDCYTYSIDRSDLYSNAENLNTFCCMLYRYRIEQLESRINEV
jgi:hypothetical protein